MYFHLHRQKKQGRQTTGKREMDERCQILSLSRKKSGSQGQGRDNHLRPMIPMEDPGGFFRYVPWSRTLPWSRIFCWVSLAWVFSPLGWVMRKPKPGCLLHVLIWPAGRLLNVWLPPNYGVQLNQLLALPSLPHQQREHASLVPDFSVFPTRGSTNLLVLQTDLIS